MAALILGCSGELPADWPAVDGIDAADAQLGHALGYVCEVRNDAVVVMNPLGEGVARAPLPAIDSEWLHQARITQSAAIFLLEGAFGGTPGQALLAERAQSSSVVAASVRTAISDTFGQAAAVGRNDPCHCGSGKKFKKCHGA